MHRDSCATANSWVVALRDVYGGGGGEMVAKPRWLVTTVQALQQSSPPRKAALWGLQVMVKHRAGP